MPGNYRWWDLPRFHTWWRKSNCADDLEKRAEKSEGLDVTDALFDFLSYFHRYFDIRIMVDIIFLRMERERENVIVFLYFSFL